MKQRETTGSEQGYGFSKPTPSKVLHSKDSITSQNRATNWGPRVQTVNLWGCSNSTTNTILRRASQSPCQPCVPKQVTKKPPIGSHLTGTLMSFKCGAPSLISQGSCDILQPTHTSFTVSSLFPCLFLSWREDRGHFL